MLEFVWVRLAWGEDCTLMVLVGCVERLEAGVELVEGRCVVERGVEFGVADVHCVVILFLVHVVFIV